MEIWKTNMEGPFLLCKMERGVRLITERIHLPLPDKKNEQSLRDYQQSWRKYKSMSNLYMTTGSVGSLCYYPPTSARFRGYTANKMAAKHSSWWWPRNSKTTTNLIFKPTNYSHLHQSLDIDTTAWRKYFIMSWKHEQ